MTPKLPPNYYPFGVSLIMKFADSTAALEAELEAALEAES
jgi:hypothetical protein